MTNQLHILIPYYVFEMIIAQAIHFSHMWKKFFSKQKFYIPLDF